MLQITSINSCKLHLLDYLQLISPSVLEFSSFFTKSILPPPALQPSTFPLVLSRTFFSFPLKPTIEFFTKSSILEKVLNNHHNSWFFQHLLKDSHSFSPLFLIPLIFRILYRFFRLFRWDGGFQLSVIHQIH